MAGISEANRLKRQARYERNRQIFLEEYAFFRSFGWDDEQIAKKLGTSRDSLLVRLARLGVKSYQDEGLRVLSAAMDRLIASGRPFSTVDLPEIGSPHDISQLFVTHNKNKTIRKIGMVRVGVFKYPQYIGTQTQENEECPPK